MPKPKTATRTEKNGTIGKQSLPTQDNFGDVLTLAEVAAYLRIKETEALKLAQLHDIPGRLIGNEWRFLKAALNDWLCTRPKRGSREAIRSVAGLWKDDPLVEEELKEIYKQRGRPMAEDGE